VLLTRASVVQLLLSSLAQTTSFKTFATERYHSHHLDRCFLGHVALDRKIWGICDHNVCEHLNIEGNIQKQEKPNALLERQ
jgi:hypothetical protein